MTRKYGKAVVARIPYAKEVDYPAAIYIRVSSAKQATKGKGSLPEQFDTVWNATINKGGQIVAVYADVCTAANRDRQAFNILLKDLRDGQFTMLGCWHSSRLVRTQLAAGELEEAVEKLKTKVHMFAVADTLDADILGVLAWAGRWERKAFRERSLMGRQAAATENRTPSGKPPFWIKTIKDESKKIVGYELKPVAKWIKWAAEAYVSGIGSTEIVRRMNQEGVPRATGRTKYGWTRQYLNQVLKYTALKGKWGPFWDVYIDVPPLVDEATWDAIQEKIQENATYTGRPAKHFVALRGLMWCSVCGQKMGTHVRDWDYVYHTLKDGTRQRYRIKKEKLKIRHVCNGQQHYGKSCRRPEYIRDAIIFDRVWDRLSEALSNHDILIAGLQSQIKALEKQDELEELLSINSRLEKLHQRELSYAEQRAEGTLSKAIQKELVLRLQQEQKELLEAQSQLQSKAEQITQARNQLASAEVLIDQLPDILPQIQRSDKEKLIMALISRIDVDADNQVTITLCLHPDVLANLPTHQQGASPQQESQSSDDSQQELSDNSIDEMAALQHEVNAARYTRNTDYKPD
ncbi:recombinase family protein [Phototrophicus methaneseepsis]